MNWREHLSVEAMQSRIRELEAKVEAALHAVPSLTRLQHIATKNTMIGKLKARYDYDEKILAGDVIHLLEDVMWADTGRPEYPADIAALAEAVK
jgi:hypothetical protein